MDRDQFTKEREPRSYLKIMFGVAVIGLVTSLGGCFPESKTEGGTTTLTVPNWVFPGGGNFVIGTYPAGGGHSPPSQSSSQSSSSSSPSTSSPGVAHK
jgi:hypothetical protein